MAAVMFLFIVSMQMVSSTHGKNDLKSMGQDGDILDTVLGAMEAVKDSKINLIKGTMNKVGESIKTLKEKGQSYAPSGSWNNPSGAGNSKLRNMGHEDGNILETVLGVMEAMKDSKINMIKGAMNKVGESIKTLKEKGQSYAPSGSWNNPSGAGNSKEHETSGSWNNPSGAGNSKLRNMGHEDGNILDTALGAMKAVKDSKINLIKGTMNKVGESIKTLKEKGQSYAPSGSWNNPSGAGNSKLRNMGHEDGNILETVLGVMEAVKDSKINMIKGAMNKVGESIKTLKEKGQSYAPSGSWNNPSGAGNSKEHETSGSWNNPSGAGNSKLRNMGHEDGNILDTALGAMKAVKDSKINLIKGTMNKVGESIKTLKEKGQSYAPSGSWNNPSGAGNSKEHETSGSWNNPSGAGNSKLRNMGHEDGNILDTALGVMEAVKDSKINMIKGAMNKVGESIKTLKEKGQSYAKGPCDKPSGAGNSKEHETSGSWNNPSGGGNSMGKDGNILAKVKSLESSKLNMFKELLKKAGVNAQTIIDKIHSVAGKNQDGNLLDTSLTSRKALIDCKMDKLKGVMKKGTDLKVDEKKWMSGTFNGHKGAWDNTEWGDKIKEK